MSEQLYRPPARFRATLQGRVQRVLELAPRAKGESADAESTKELLGELHTLKGESRMLGLMLLSTVAHGLEDAFADAQLTHDDLLPVLDAVGMSLAETTAEDLAHQMLVTALSELGLEDEVARFEEPAPEEPAVAPGGASARVERWSQVDVNVVQSLSEKLAMLETDLGAHVSELAQRSNGTPEARVLNDEGTRLLARLSDCLLLSLSLRLATLEPELKRLGAHMRRAAGAAGTELDVVIRSGGVQVEREVLDLMADPLIHLANNAVEHGVLRRAEASGAQVVLSAENVGASVVVRVEDNGPGIEVEQVWRRAVDRGLVGPNDPMPSPERVVPLIFEPGFSTREEVDHGAGRGVGLDVVRRQVEGVGGGVDVESTPGEGSAFVLTIPAALTRERLLVVRAAETLLGLPVDWVEEALGPIRVAGHETHVYEGITLPLRHFATALSLGEVPAEPQLVVVKLEGRMVVVGCDAILGQYELVRRPTSRALARSFGVSASGQLGDGRLVLMLDRGFVHNALSARTERVAPEARAGRQSPTILVVDDSVIVRDLIGEVLGEEGYLVEMAVDGVEALARIESTRVSLVLSDIEMPRMDGFELLEQIRQRSATLPVIMLSAKSSKDDRLRASSLGASAYVTKREFESRALLDVVRRHAPLQV